MDAEPPRWRWTLANRSRVVAELSSDGRIESVRVDDRTLSECERGRKPSGHVVDVPPRDEDGETLRATVTFDPRSPICVLRVDDHEVVPFEWPTPRPPKKIAPAPTPTRLPLVALALPFVIAIIAIVLVMRGCSRESPETAPTIATYRAPSGLFVAHPPTEMKLTPLTLPSPMSGVIGAASERAAIVIAAGRLDASTSRDPWVLSKQYLPEALPLLPRGGGKLEETDRRDDTCLGQRGAVVAGIVASPTGARSRLWSCTFVRDDAGYLVLHVHAEPVTAADERRLRVIVDATELTNLAEISPASSAN